MSRSRRKIIITFFLLSMGTIWSDVWLPSGPVCSRVSSTTLSISGANVYVTAWKRAAVTSNAVHCNWNLSNLGGLIIWYLDTSLLCVASFSLASCDVTALINFTVLLCIIFMRMFYRVMKRIHQFAANFLSYIPTKYYWNRSTSDLVIAKSKRVNFFLKHSVHSQFFVTGTQLTNYDITHVTMIRLAVKWST